MLIFLCAFFVGVLTCFTHDPLLKTVTQQIHYRFFDVGIVTLECQRNITAANDFMYFLFLVQILPSPAFIVCFKDFPEQNMTVLLPLSSVTTVNFPKLPILISSHSASTIRIMSMTVLM